MSSFKLLGLLLTAACGASSPSPTPATTPQPTTVASDGDPSCPVAVPGTSVSVEDAASGAALVFVTTGDAAEVRKRAAAFAQMHNEKHAAMGPLPDGAAGSADPHAGHDMSKMGGEHAGHDMSKMGGEHAGHDMSKMGKMGGDHAAHSGGMISVHSKAVVADVTNGAKIELTVGPSDVAKLQSELRMHASHMANGSCKM